MSCRENFTPSQNRLKSVGNGIFCEMSSSAGSESAPGQNCRLPLHHLEKPDARRGFASADVDAVGEFRQVEGDGGRTAAFRT